MELDAGGLAAAPDDFYVAPADAPDAGAEGLHGGFLGGEAAGELGGASATVGGFALGVDAAEEAVAVVLVNAADPGDFDDVNAGYEHWRPRCVGLRGLLYRMAVV